MLAAQAVACSCKIVKSGQYSDHREFKASLYGFYCIGRWGRSPSKSLPSAKLSDLDSVPKSTLIPAVAVGMLQSVSSKN